MSPANLYLLQVANLLLAAHYLCLSGIAILAALNRS
jgi:hypothetical protein